ncbi:hypothetical protein PR048_006316 [Dryococelus australis]|uniref:Uncharacterized protein n=1 Tax=Dryococelus australis TaxID=614101 RepID=A0ABQ9IAQ2_9NEOP|nr:hypothetical protein PR048_006316 [Dryococelus australis]
MVTIPTMDTFHPPPPRNRLPYWRNKPVTPVTRRLDEVRVEQRLLCGSLSKNGQFDGLSAHSRPVQASAVLTVQTQPLLTEIVILFLSLACGNEHNMAACLSVSELVGVAIRRALYCVAAVMHGLHAATQRLAASSGMIPTCENPCVTRPGIEPGSPWREASRLITQPLWRQQIVYGGVFWDVAMLYSHRLVCVCVLCGSEPEVGDPVVPLPKPARQDNIIHCTTTSSPLASPSSSHPFPNFSLLYSRARYIVLAHSEAPPSPPSWAPEHSRFHCRAITTTGGRPERELLLASVVPSGGTGPWWGNIDFKRLYTEITFAIGSEFISHALDDSAPIADLQICRKCGERWTSILATVEIWAGKQQMQCKGRRRTVVAAVEQITVARVCRASRGPLHMSLNPRIFAVSDRLQTCCASGWRKTCNFNYITEQLVTPSGVRSSP